MTMLNNLNEPANKINTETLTVGVAAVRFPDNVDAAWVQIMHEHPTAKVYIGGSNVSVANGFGSLQANDTTERYPCQNSNIFYAISDTAGVTLRIMWGE